MRRCEALLLGLIPLGIIQAQPVLPATGPQTWSPPAECRERLPEDYHPITRTERTHLYLDSVIGPQVFLFTAASAGVSTAANVPHEWEANSRGFGYRAGSFYGQTLIANTVQSGVAWARGEDNRYFVSGEQGTWRRLKYAVSSAFLSRRDNGTRTFSIAAIAGPAAGAAISRAWQPPSNSGVGDAALSFGLAIAFSVGSNVAHEFMPGPLRKFLP